MSCCAYKTGCKLKKEERARGVERVFAHQVVEWKFSKSQDLWFLAEAAVSLP